MAVKIYDTDLVNTQITFDDGDIVIVNEGVTIANESVALYETVNDMRFINNGTLLGGAGDTILLTNDDDLSPSNFLIENGATGSVYGANTGFFVQGDFSEGGETLILNNAGYVSAVQYSAIVTDRVEVVNISNAGTLFSLAQGGGYPAEGGITVRGSLTGAISNTGTITTNAIPSLETSSAYATSAAVSISGSDAGSQHVVVNSGVIESPAIAFYSDSEDLLFSNSGAINGLVFVESAIAGDLANEGTMNGGAVIAGDNLSVANAGNINGDVVMTATVAGDLGNAQGANIRGDVILSGAGGITFDNLGTVGGDVIMDSGDLMNADTGAIIGDITFNGADGVQFDNLGTVDGDITFGAGDDIYIGESGGVTTYGASINMGGGDDAFFGGATRDRVFDDGGDDDIEGNGGNDSFRAGTGANFYDGGDGYDYLSYYSFNSRVRIDLEAESTSGGGSGNAAANDRFINIEAIGGTNGGGDTLLGSADRNSLFGWGGDDKLYGRGGNDKLSGGEGDDFFDGGGGTDLLIGGGGADRFHFDRGEGDDLIQDFENNIDQLEFDNFGYLSNASDALSYATQVGSDVFFDFGGDGTVLVLGVTTGQLANDIEIV